jgi:DNA-binding winged helix-turn-helix (wHTH) protein
MRNVILTPLLLLLICLPGYSSGIERDKTLVTMRKIGHEVLLASGDTTSWVLPIEQVNASTFLISFQKPFSFTPKSLVEIIHRHLLQDHLSLDYLVEVNEGNMKRVAYSYEVSQLLDIRAIACVTRTPPRGLYSIQIKFAPPPMQTASIAGVMKLAGVLLPVLLLAMIGWKFYSRKAPALTEMENPASSELVNIGKLTFCLEKQILRLGNERIELSSKESKLLKIFASAPNEVIDRDQLMKQVWEDEGVFVGRSLDVFVSRLRKKLQPAPSVRLVNIHGKGYKLEIDSQKEQVTYA